MKKDQALVNAGQATLSGGIAKRLLSDHRSWHTAMHGAKRHMEGDGPAQEMVLQKETRAQ